MNYEYQNSGRCSRSLDVLAYCSCQAAVELEVEFLDRNGQVVQECYVDAESWEEGHIKCADILSRGDFPGSVSYRVV